MTAEHRPTGFDGSADHGETSLDPEDWDAFRQLGHRLFDDLVDYLRDVRDRPAWQPQPPHSRQWLETPIPQQGEPLEAICAALQAQVLPYPTGNIHPRFWSWVGGTGTTTGLLADMMISAMNATSLGFDDVASTRVELQLLDWLKDMMGFPAGSSGLLVSGGSMANLVGLAVARNHTSGYALRDEGIDAQNRPRQMFYASTETHSSVRKAIELLGLGGRSLRLIPVQDNYRIDMDTLEQAISTDRAAGLQPSCIIANAGTVNTGASDPITQLAELATREGLWLHVDGAFGAFARLSTTAAAEVAGLERADSIAFDLHKWMYVQYDCGCTLVRHAQSHRDTFSVTPAYLRKFKRGLAAGPLDFSAYGVQLSRSFRALRGWMQLRAYGVEGLARQIEQNVRQAAWLAARVDAEPELERLAPVPMNIVNFRYRAAGLEEAGLEELNAEILMRLHEDGIAAPSSTVLGGRFALRVAICNHRTRREDLAALTTAVVELGRELLDTPTRPAPRPAR